MHNKKSYNIVYFFLIVFGGICVAMEQDLSIKSDEASLGLLQQLYACLGSTKVSGDCQSVLVQAQELDRLKSQITMPHIMPIYAPWRDSYKVQEREEKHDEKKGMATISPCPFCDQFGRVGEDRKNYIIQRNKHSVVMFNRNPYLPLHFLVVPYKHVAKFEELADEERDDVLHHTSIWLHRLKTLGVGGANIYFNLESKSAGASLPGHIHEQVLSRWQGDNAAITSLIAEDIIKAERSDLLSEFYQPSIETEKLARVFQPFSQLLSRQQWYQQQLDQKTDGEECYMCETFNKKELDEKNLVVQRLKHWLLLLHRYGYAGGHLLLVSKHGKSFDTLSTKRLKEFNLLITLIQKKLKEVIRPDGLNIVINEGKCAGNTFKNHLCCNIVPRLVNDTSATAVICGRPIMERNLDSLRNRLIKAIASAINADTICAVGKE